MGQWTHKGVRETFDFEMRKEISGYPFNGTLRPQGLADSTEIRAFVFDYAVFQLHRVRS